MIIIEICKCGAIKRMWADTQANTGQIGTMIKNSKKNGTTWDKISKDELQGKDFCVCGKGA